ncbi:MAG: endonuclease/exonuclease/phosphatase family protein [Phycisphaerae bacterium]|nr:endonuclease/exonuclease/phosphatase family protein [Phycisphaerae bacterium]
MSLTASATAQIRVMSYNIAQFKGNSNALSEVLALASADDSHGFATPVSIFLFQEVDEADINLLQAVVGSGYTMATFTDQNDSSWGGAQAMFYHSKQFVENSALHEDIFTGAGRHADRWALNVSGYTGKRIYVYSMHLKAATGTANQETRRQGAETIRDDILTLPTGSHIIVSGDMNFYSPSEPAYGWFTASGAGEVIDPLGNGTSWSGGTNAVKHTQSPLLNQNGGLIGGGLDDRFDFQFLSPSLLDGGGFDHISGTYRTFGNDGNHYNDAITDGNNTYFPGDTPRGNALANELIIASDHMPLLADYQLPAVLGWNWDPAANRVFVGADATVDFEIRNDAPVSHALGADVLHVDVVVEGDFSGSESVSVAALSAPEFVSLPVDTSVSGNWNATVTLTSTSEETQTTPEVVKIGGEIIEHANASFSYTQDLDWYTYDISFEQNNGVQTFNVLLFNYGYDGSQSLLEVDNVSTPAAPVMYEGMSTTEVGSIPSLITFSIDTDVVDVGTYTSPMPIEVSDENLPGEISGISMLTVRIEITPAESCPEDFDGNGNVAVADLLVLIGDWGGNDPMHDLDGNGTVGVGDILQLIAAWGPC